MKNLNLPIVIIISIFLFTSCAYVKMRTIPGFKFEKESTFSITSFTTDADTKTLAELNYLLQQKGFNIVSNSNASKAIQNKDAFNFKYNNEEIKEILTIKDIKSVYEIRIQYKYYYDVFKYNYKEFKAIIIDMNSNKVVSYYISGDKPINRVLRQFTEKIAKDVYHESN
nr:hypothetical protein [Flavobacterium sp.]